MSEILTYLQTERDARLVILDDEGLACGVPTQRDLIRYSSGGLTYPVETIGVRFTDARDNDVTVTLNAREVGAYLRATCAPLGVCS
jgi:hypothetical protein